MMEDQRTKSLSGIPGLAQIPILKYLFPRATTDHSENEIVFVLIPHIIRGPEGQHGNVDMLDVGTANALELRRSNSKRQRRRARLRAAAPALGAPPQMPTPQGQTPQNLVPQAQVPQNQVPQNQVPQNQFHKIRRARAQERSCSIRRR